MTATASPPLRTPRSRERFRTYWSYVAPGVTLIRMALLWPLKRAAEQRARSAA